MRGRLASTIVPRGSTGLRIAWTVLALAVAAGVAYLIVAPDPGPLVARDKTIRVSVPPPDEAALGAPAPSGGASADLAAASAPAPEFERPAAAAAPTTEADPAPPPVPENRPQTARRTDGADPARPAATQIDDTRPAAPGQPTLQPAWKRHARGLQAPSDVPRIAVVVRGLGLSSAATEAAIERLPGAISLSFTPYARRAPEWSQRARAGGHEVLVDLPMEPRDFPARDPGPRALMVEDAKRTNLERLDWALSRGREIVGGVARMGSRFLASERAVAPILRELRARGLMFVDNGTAQVPAALRIARRIDLPHAVNDRTLDDGQVSRPAVQARLVEIERIARQDGLAVALAHPYPVVIDLLAAWSQNVEERGFALVPITAAVQPRSSARAAR